MKIQILSDIHFEFMKDGGENFFKYFQKGDAEVLVLAGDKK